MRNPEFIYRIVDTSTGQFYQNSGGKKTWATAYGAISVISLKKRFNPHFKVAIYPVGSPELISGTDLENRLIREYQERQDAIIAAKQERKRQAARRKAVIEEQKRERIEARIQKKLRKQQAIREINDRIEMKKHEIQELKNRKRYL